MHSPMKHKQPIQLASSQFAFVSAGLLAILAVLWAYSPYEWQELYYREFVVPRLQTRYGFRYGPIRMVRDGTVFYEGKGIVNVVPGGRFSRIGVRAGDAPFEFHGGGFTAMNHALETAERGGFAAFDVVNADDWERGRESFRTIPVYPRVRETPVSLGRRNELPSPVGPLTIVAVESPVDNTIRELWVWDSVLGSRKKLWDVRHVALATWSADGGWLAVTDRALGLPWRCVLIEPTGGEALNLTDVLMALPPSMRPVSSDRLDCEIFGWVEDRPRRVAVIFRNLDATYGEPWIYNFFFDVTARRLVAAERR